MKHCFLKSVLFLLFSSSLISNAQTIQYTGTKGITLNLIKGKKEGIFVSKTELEKQSENNIKIISSPPIADEGNYFKEFVLIIRKKSKSGYTKIPNLRFSHPTPSFDSISLQEHVPIFDTIFLKHYYILEKGDYKIRVMRKIYNGRTEEYIYSNWIFFRLSKKITLPLIFH